MLIGLKQPSSPYGLQRSATSPWRRTQEQHCISEGPSQAWQAVNLICMGPAGVVDVDPPFAWNCQVVAGAGVVENVRQLYSDMHSYLAGQPHVMHKQYPTEAPEDALEDALSHGLLKFELTVCQWVYFDRLGSYGA